MSRIEIRIKRGEPGEVVKLARISRDNRKYGRIPMLKDGIRVAANWCELKDCSSKPQESMCWKCNCD